MSRFMEIVTNTKNIAAMIATVAGVFGITYGTMEFLDSKYASNQALAEVQAQVTKQELKLLLKDALDELYFWRSQARKYPDDPQIQQKLAEAEDNVERIKRQLSEV